MVNDWKERGVVPDSDDEEESADSQDSWEGFVELDDDGKVVIPGSAKEKETVGEEEFGEIEGRGSRGEVGNDELEDNIVKDGALDCEAPNHAASALEGLDQEAFTQSLGQEAGGHVAPNCEAFGDEALNHKGPNHEDDPLPALPDLCPDLDMTTQLSYHLQSSRPATGSSGLMLETLTDSHVQSISAGQTLQVLVDLGAVNFSEYNPMSEDDRQGRDSEDHRDHRPSSALQPLQEEISQSYVRLSPSSESLSSMASSQFSHMEEEAISSGGEVSSSAKEPAKSPQLSNLKEPVPDTAYSPPKRALRQRNLIQLHPYALEGEKYRQMLTGAGIKPVHVTSQDERVPKRPRDMEATQDTEFLAEEDSQNTTVEQETLIPSSDIDSSPIARHKTRDRHHSSFNSDSNANGEDVSDTELPDISTLVAHYKEIENRGSKRRKTSHQIYGKTKSGISSRESGQNLNQDIPEGDVYDVPQSPPATSSPSARPRATAFDKHRGFRVPRPLIENAGRAGSPEQDSLPRPQPAPSLPTPATSSVRREAPHFDISSGEEEEAPSSSQDSTASRSSSPVRVGEEKKTLRGVLPASWWRQGQVANKPNPKPAPPVTLLPSRSRSPEPTFIRKGIARPINRGNGDGLDSPQNPLASLFFSDEESEDEAPTLPMLAERAAIDSPTPLSQSTSMGYAVEDNRGIVDAMLPSQRRQQKLAPGNSTRKRRENPGSLLRKSTAGPSFQSRIINHISKFRKSQPSHQSSQSKIQVKSDRAAKRATKPEVKPPSLSILDVVSPSPGPRARQPHFIRLAARIARNLPNRGQQSPSRKFIRLDNREDTAEVQTILESWRQGTIQRRVPRVSPQHHRQPLHQLSINQPRVNSHSRLQPNNEQFTSRTSLIDRSRAPRRALVAKPNEARLNWITERQHATEAEPVKLEPQEEEKPDISPATVAAIISQRRRLANQAQPAISRPAQLETSEVHYQHRHPGAVFGSTKRTLDREYRRAHKGATIRGDMQLGRFLAEGEDIFSHLRPSVEHDEAIKVLPKDKGARRRKREPKHVDANAVEYRQPEEPLVLDTLDTASQVSSKSKLGGKLFGLADRGIQYTVDFEIFPIQQGVYFHESTFIGSGKLEKALRTSSLLYHDVDRDYAFYNLPAKQLRWGAWNRTVSLELGECFEWITNQLIISVLEKPETDPPKFNESIIDCMLFMVDYFQNHLSFDSGQDSRDCLERMTKVLQDLTNCLEELPRCLKKGDNADNRKVVELSVYETVLVFQAFQIALSEGQGIDQKVRDELEELLQRAAKSSVRLLFVIGLSPIRDLYDRLQYLATRESGIRSNQSSAQAWVILMHVMAAAKIPRVSFWDAINLHLLQNTANETDAREFERTWYSVFSLLPLVEFDELGNLQPGLRYKTSFDNWMLPQKILKRVFELYASNSKQSPSFNDYCRALFSRCHHLMQVWGWRKYATIVGTFFDFFSSNSFAHLRNERTYHNSKFISDSIDDPSVAIEREDHCFKIFLKIVAYAIKEQRTAGDGKGIRNLVTRLLPNHDFQNQKERARAADLTSLKNHLDLISTMWWAAPPELKPQIRAIRELVDQERAQKEAYIANVRNREMDARERPRVRG